MQLFALFHFHMPLASISVLMSTKYRKSKCPMSHVEPTSSHTHTHTLHGPLGAEPQLPVKLPARVLLFLSAPGFLCISACTRFASLLTATRTCTSPLHT